ncbi:TolC family protein [Sulfurospirillum halorespirans]|uniref:Putative outer membrane efflux protein n=1 Tax=Sulfurospirillum halorespirans DSM 13726 TaxID=1193502 RepID=A0A1D7THW5_9BACT|nr:TolC family protein [Sulfurospirillum halorespirans]AOO64587.1 putative outer membrane efflux protein [Sulfurospirillum halorespirans DSM 13726]
MRIILLVLLALRLCFAEEGLHLDDAIQKVKEHNSEIVIAKFDERIKLLEHQAALGANYGSLELSQAALRSNDALNIFGYKLQSREATFADFGFKQFSGSNYMLTPNDLNNPSDRNHFQTKIEYTLPIYTGGKIEQYGKITQALQTMSTLDKEALILQKIYELKKSFFAISLLDAHLYTLHIIASNTAKLEAKTAMMLEEGYVKKVDLLEVQSKQADVDRLIHQAEANRTLLYAFVSFLVDEPVTQISGKDEEAPTLLSSDAQILSDNLEIKKAEQGVEISKMGIALQQSAFLPQVGAFANYGSSDDKLMNDFSKNDAYTVGLQVKWNLFNGGSDNNNLEKARVENLKASQQLVLAKKQIALHVKQIQTQIQNDEYEINSLKKEVELSHLIYENYAGRYEQKLVSINDVLIKQSEELTKVLRLKEVQNARNEKIFELQKLASKEVQ